jgi:hypothetical protein
MSRDKASTDTYKSLGPGYCADHDDGKGNHGFGRGSTREDAAENAKEDAEWKEENHRF